MRHRWQHFDWQPQLATLDQHMAAVLAGLADLRMVKPGELPARALHRYGCPAPRGASCVCADVGGPELVFSDWDELNPNRHYRIPERFYVQHS